LLKTIQTEARPASSVFRCSGRVNGEGPMMPACEAISECNFRLSRQAIKDVTRGPLRGSCHLAVVAASVNISVDFRAVLTVGPLSDR
jgi:hypothetical protein